MLARHKQSPAATGWRILENSDEARWQKMDGVVVAALYEVVNRMGRSAVSLAKLSLIYEWRRFMPAVQAVAFAGLLMMVQLGLLLGMFSTVSVVVERARGSLGGVPEYTQF